MQDGRLPPVAPLSARQVALNVLLGVQPPELPVSSLVKIGTLFGIAERTTRVALTRMVADGDLAAENGVYRLTDRLTRRRTVLDEVRWPALRDWDGTWEMAVVTTTSRPAADRTALRRFMVESRLAELREGVWMRPRNLLRPLDEAADQCAFFTTVPDEPHELAAALWNLPAWAEEARRLRNRLDGEHDLASAFMLASEVIRHLLIDPRLPVDLQPDGWPAADLQQRYVDFEASVTARIRRYGEEHPVSGS